MAKISLRIVPPSRESVPHVPTTAARKPHRCGPGAIRDSLLGERVPPCRPGPGAPRPGPGRSWMKRVGADDKFCDPAVSARGVPHEALRRLRNEQPVAWQEEHAVGD